MLVVGAAAFFILVLAELCVDFKPIWNRGGSWAVAAGDGTEYHWSTGKDWYATQSLIRTEWVRVRLAVLLNVMGQRNQ